MQELARGLVGSEYWELLHLILVSNLEEAKGALESEVTSVEQFRLRQGEAKAYRHVHSFILKLSRSTSEEDDGKESD